MWIQPIDQLRISIRMLHSIAQLSILHLTNCKSISLSYSISKFGLRVAESQVRIPAPCKYCKAASAAAAVSAATASTAASAAAEATEASSEAEEAVKNKNKGA